MMDKAIRDYVSLAIIFEDKSDEELEKIRRDLRTMMESEPYMYLKYHQLKRMVGMMLNDRTPGTKEQSNTVYLAEVVSAKKEAPKEAPKSKWRA